MSRSRHLSDLPEPVRHYFREVGQMDAPHDLLDDAFAKIKDSPQAHRFSPVLAFGLGAAAVVILSLVGYAYWAGLRDVGVPTASPSPTPSSVIQQSPQPDTPEATSETTSPATSEEQVPAFDLALVKAAFTAECADPTVVDELFCDAVDIGGMTISTDNLIVPTTLTALRVEETGICQQVSTMRRSEPIGFFWIKVLDKDGNLAFACG